MSATQACDLERAKSAVVPNFRFGKEATQNAAEEYGVKAVMMTAVKQEGE